IKSHLIILNDFDFVVVGDNSEGEYSSVGGRIYGCEDEVVIQNNIFSRQATERAMRFAFVLSSKRNKSVTSATKSNGIYHSMPFWDDIFNKISEEYPSVHTDSQHIDALAAFFVT